MRYHKDVYFPLWAEKELENFSRELNWKPTILSNHVLNKFYEDYRMSSRKIREVIMGTWLDAKDIFEFYGKEGQIEKVCYRIENAVDDKDLIIVINAQKVVITVYLNSSGDYHASLNKSLYEKGDSAC